MIAHKTIQQAEGVLAPKVQGTIYLDEATRGDRLDFFALFSSLAAVRGNTGQADYAYANAFLDGFAEWRESLRARGERSGRTCAIDWPLWREGSMDISRNAAEALAQNAGLAPLDTAAGLTALQHAIGNAPARFVVAQGDAGRFLEALRGAPNKVAHSVPANPSAIAPVLIDLAAKTLKLAPECLQPNRQLSEFGMDSITFVELTDEINLRFKLDLSPAIFFEHPSIRDLAAHLANAFGDRVAPTPAVAEAPPTALPAAIARRSSYTAPRGVNDAVAIVGMAGVMPGSKDLDEFWQHLRRGDDLITEIPPTRWDWREFFGDPAKEPGRTNSRWGGFMHEVDRFDARFFGISPREAALIDSQHRIFLEVVWHAIENAGWRPSDLAGSRTGLFVGVGHSDYADLVRRNGIPVEAHSATGMSNAMLPNRISYLLDLHGPSGRWTRPARVRWWPCIAPLNPFVGMSAKPPSRAGFT